MPSNYDNAAIFYDQLAGLVFGKALIRSQIYLLNYIPANTTVMIAGGGTGWILEEIAKVHPSGLKITYVEISAKMLAMAKQKNAGGNKVAFIHSAIEDIATTNLYDVVITPFLFDNFTEETLPTTFNHLHNHLKIDGLWLCTDFQLTGRLWQSYLLKVMYLFFKVLCRIETTQMPDIHKSFTTNGYKTLTVKTFYGDFIVSTLYKKRLISHT